MRFLFLLGILASPVHAGCFTLEELPAKVVYDSGLTLEILGQEAGVLSYRTRDTVTRLKHGLWPLDHISGDAKSEYRWDGLLPDLTRVIIDGGTARAEGQFRQGKGDWKPVVIEVEVLGEAFFDWEDCRYKVVEFRKTTSVEGKKISEGVVLYAPDAMFTFRTEQTDPATGLVTSVELKELH